MARVLTCAEADLDALTGECAAPMWVEDSGVFPRLPIADAMEIASAIALLWAIAFCWRVIRRTVESRGSD